jgi:hypothetical protein
MTTFTQLAPAPYDPPEPFTDRLRLAVAAYLARVKGSSREHTESDLRCYLAWCAERGLDPRATQLPHLELYMWWMQEIRRYRPSTVSRRFLRCGRVLPDVRSRWHPEALTRRARPPPRGARRIAHPRDHPPAVRSTAHRRCPGNRPIRPASPWWPCSARRSRRHPGHRGTPSQARVMPSSRPCSMPASTSETSRSRPVTPTHARDPHFTAPLSRSPSTSSPHHGRRR